MNLKFWKRKEPQPVRTLHFVDTGENVKLEDWRKNTALVSEAQHIINSPAFRRIMHVLRTESPANYALNGADLAARALHQAKIEGYAYCLQMMLLLATPIPPFDDTEETFEDPVVETTEPEG